MHCYVGIERNTKDLDLFVRPDDCRGPTALAALGCRTQWTFPHWLGKAYRGGEFADVIFSSGNGVATVDDQWFEHAAEGVAVGRAVRLVPPEEMIWQKVYIQERSATTERTSPICSAQLAATSTGRGCSPAWAPTGASC